MKRKIFTQALNTQQKKKIFCFDRNEKIITQSTGCIDLIIAAL